MLPLIFDTDQHITEPPDFWTSRMPRKWQDVAMRVIDHPVFKDTWSYNGGRAIRSMGLSSVGSEDPRKLSSAKRYDEIDPGCYDPIRRREVMDIDGVGACLLFPSIASALSLIGDEELYLESTRVYNDAVMDWAIACDRCRVIPAALMPALGVEHAVAELARAASMGFKHYMFNQWPSGNPLPTPEDDAFFAQVQETGMVVSFHGYGTGRPKEPPVTFVDGKPQPADSRAQTQETVAAVRAAGLNSTTGLATLFLSGILGRFPRLKMCLIETSVGWLPYFMERLDALYDQHRWLDPSLRLASRPSDQLGNVKWSLDREMLAAKYRREIGMDTLAFGTDWPHIGSFYPHTRFHLELLTQGFTHEEREKLLWSNAAGLYGVPPVS